MNPLPRRLRHALTALLILTGLAVATAGGYALRTVAAPGAGPVAAPVPAPTVSTVDGRSVVTVDPAAQRRSGLRTQALAPAAFRPTTPAYAQVLALQPLIDWRSSWAEARAGQKAADAAADAAKRDEARSRGLYRDGRNVSLKDFEAARARASELTARADAARQRLADLRAMANTQFGATLAGWLVDEASPAWRRLAQHRASLVRVARPLRADASAPPQQIEIVGDGGQRLNAGFVARAASADPMQPGEPLLYLTQAALPAGERLDAALPAAGPPASGVVVPDAALVWYAGQRWVYLRQDASHFARVPVAQGAPADGGLFVAQGLAAGAQVVVQGAQLLLSEELKPRAVGTACKDPECDD